MESTSKPASGGLKPIIAAVAAMIVIALGATWMMPSTGPSSSSEPPPPWVGPLLPDTTGAVGFALLPADATLVLPATNLPESVTAEGVFVISGFEERSNHARSWFEAPLPFEPPASGKRFAPPGMEVWHGDQELSWSELPASMTNGFTWRIHKDRLVVTTREAPETIRVLYPLLLRSLDRLNFGSSELSPADYAEFGLSLKQFTNNGMLLPAPGTAEWTITVPPAGRFETVLGLVPTPIGLRSTGAEVSVEVTHDDRTAEVARRKVPLDDTFKRIEADLSRWSGEEVVVRLISEPGSNSAYDYVFVRPTIHGLAEKPVRRVIYIGIDTVRPDHLSVNGYARNTTPELDAFAADAVVFERAWAAAPRTRPSFRTSTTGRWPLDAVCSTNIGEVFSNNGWATAGIVSNVHLSPRFDFSDGFDYWRVDGKAKADDQVNRAIEWLTDNDDRDAYLFLHIMDPHIFYKPPIEFSKPFIESLPLGPDPTLPAAFNRWEVYKWMRGDKITEQRKQHMIALYDGELAYTSHELGRLFDAIDEMDGDNLVVIHSDHGEEFWEHGGFEHNHTLYDETTRALLWVRPPGGSGHEHMRIKTPVSLVDVAPTLYEFAGFEEVPESDGISLVPLMRGEPGDDLRPLQVAHLRYDREQWGVIYNGFKYIVTTADGSEQLFNLTEDPGEFNNLIGSVDPSAYRNQLGLVHDMSVGMGWRMAVSLSGSEPIDITLPEKASMAGVIHPESITRHPANQAWGETPKLLPEEVGEVSLSDDGLKVTVVPGENGDGVLYVLFDRAVDPSLARLSRGAEALELKPAAEGLMWTAGRWRVEVVQSVIVVPPDSEADRIRACEAEELGEADSDITDMLRELGYVGEEGVNRPR